MIEFVAKSKIDNLNFHASECIKTEHGNYWIRFKNNRQRDDFIIKLFLRAIFYNNDQNLLTVSNNLVIIKSPEIEIDEVKL